MAMIIIGLLLLAAAVAAAVVLIAQNHAALVDVHALGNTWQVHLYWVLVAGMVVVAVALLGLRAASLGAGRTRRLRRERAVLVRERAGLVQENERLSEIVETNRDDHAVATPDATPVADATPVTPAPVVERDVMSNS
jgi:membrane protein implicated in regulation of membrane protease activity